MSDEPTLVDLPASRAARDEAVARVAEHSSDDWTAEARATLQRVAAERERFICDALWEYGLRRPDNDARALGAILLWGARRGWITRTGEYRPSAAVASHAVPRQVWQSLIFQKGLKNV